MNAFDELERQLIESVASRRGSRRAVAAIGLGRWWRSRGGFGALVVAVSLLAVIMLDAGRMARRPLPRASASGLIAAVTDNPAEGACGPCRAVGGRLHAPMAEEEQEGGELPNRNVRIRYGRPIVRWTSPEGQSGPVG
jgi:hypothetical protein